MALIDALKTISVTDPGRVRGHNEDCVESRPEIGVHVLADGMGDITQAKWLVAWQLH